MCRKDPYIVGKVLIVFGLLALVLRIFSDVSLGELWPLALVALGIYQRRTGGDVSQARTLVVVGFVFLAFSTDLISWSMLGMLWPFALLAVGVYLLANAKRGQVKTVFGNAADSISEKVQTCTERFKEMFETDKVQTSNVKETYSSSHENSTASEPKTLNEVVLFGSSRPKPSRLSATNSANCFFGDLKVDLRHVQEPPAIINLSLTCSFGEIDVRVPESWRVEVKGSSVMAEVKNDCLNPAQPQSILYVNTSCFFGEVSISN